jgi:hypothetical protein
MTPEQQAMLLAMVEHYNEIAKGRTLNDFVTDEFYYRIIAGMLESIVVETGHADWLQEGIGIVLAQAVSVGIWIAEQGKTRMLEGKGGLQ